MLCVVFLFLTPPVLFFASLSVVLALLSKFLAPLSFCFRRPSLLLAPTSLFWRPSLCSWRPYLSVFLSPLSLSSWRPSLSLSLSLCVLGAPRCVLGAPLLEEMTETLLYRGRCYKTNETWAPIICLLSSGGQQTALLRPTGIAQPDPLLWFTRAYSTTQVL